MTTATEQISLGAEPVVHRPERLLGWRDSLVPLLCAVIVLAESYYISQADLGFSQRRLLNAETIWANTVQHLQITVTITVLVIAVAVPLGVMVTRRRTRWVAPFVLGFGNVGQAAPIVGLIAIVGSFQTGFWAVVLIIAAFSMLPVIRNTIVGIQQVDAGVIDAARGMGMSPRGILFGVELPLAVPIIAAGARTSLVLAVAVVALGTDLNAGGLGNLVFAGIKLNRFPTLVAGALLIAVLALLIDWLGGLAQRILTPRGVR